MAGMIQIKPEELRQKAQSVRQCKEAHVNNIQTLTNMVRALTDTWQGEAQRQFTSEYDNWLPQSTKFADMLETYARHMDEAAQRMEETDNELRSKMSETS